jgi:hypothetical protein
LTLSNTSSFLTWSVQLIFSILLQHHISFLNSRQKDDACGTRLTRNGVDDDWGLLGCHTVPMFCYHVTGRNMQEDESSRHQMRFARTLVFAHYGYFCGNIYALFMFLSWLLWRPLVIWSHRLFTDCHGGGSTLCYLPEPVIGNDSHLITSSYFARIYLNVILLSSPHPCNSRLASCSRPKFCRNLLTPAA